METLAPNEMIYDLNRMLNRLQNQNFGGCFFFGVCVCLFVLNWVFPVKEILHSWPVFISS